MTALRKPASTTEEKVVTVSELNDQYVFVEAQSRIYCVQHGKFISVEQFKIALANQVVIRETGSERKRVPAANAWLQSPDRRRCRDVVFAPGKPSFTDGCLNMWRSRSCEPKAGDLAPWNTLMDCLSWLAGHAQVCRTNIRVPASVSGYQ